MDPLYFVVILPMSILLAAWFLGRNTADLPAADLDIAVPIPLCDRDGYLCELLHTTPLDYGDDDEPAN